MDRTEGQVPARFPAMVAIGDLTDEELSVHVEELTRALG